MFFLKEYIDNYVEMKCIKWFLLIIVLNLSKEMGNRVEYLILLFSRVLCNKKKFID